MHKPKIYLDTSVVSRFRENTHGHRAAYKLLTEIKEGAYKAVISELTLNDIINGQQKDKQPVMEALDTITYDIIDDSEKAKEYASILKENGISSDETACMHIGYALAGQCDILVSWDYEHTANIRTISGVNFEISLLGLKRLSIYPPSMVIQNN